jgi:membrane-associated phospholipid phosphatase
MKNLAKRFERQIRFLQKRLSPEGYAGLHLTIGVLVILVAGWWFGAIAEDLSPDDSLVLLDQRIAVWFHDHATPAMTHVAKAITFFGSVAWVTTVSTSVALFFLFRRAWTNFSLLALTMIGGSTINVLLKHFFHRQRPILENPLVTLSSYGFPSGHTMGGTMLYGLLALIAAQKTKSHSMRMTCFVAACFLIFLIGFTRIYLGAHFFSDVLGAIAAGIAWLTLCWTAIETLRRRHSPARR